MHFHLCAKLNIFLVYANVVSDYVVIAGGTNGNGTDGWRRRSLWGLFYHTCDSEGCPSLKSQSINSAMLAFPQSAHVRMC